MGRPNLFDLHCHLDWFADARKVAREAAELGLFVFANTVTPEGFAKATDTFATCDNVAVGVGAHPWWVADGRLGADDVSKAAQLARDHTLVGEIGLDFSPAHAPTTSNETQVATLRRILAACDVGAREGSPKLISLHAVRSAGAVLDLLEETGCLTSCRCVFHWFSGSGDELTRAVRAGCFFSVNEMMLATRRGRAYARQLPAGRLLVETDLPPKEGAALGAASIAAGLDRTLDALADLRGTDVRATVADNARRLMRRT